jgi:hypothetical protein
MLTGFEEVKGGLKLVADRGDDFLRSGPALTNSDQDVE